MVLLGLMKVLQKLVVEWALLVLIEVFVVLVAGVVVSLVLALCLLGGQSLVSELALVPQAAAEAQVWKTQFSGGQVSQVLVVEQLALETVVELDVLQGPSVLQVSLALLGQLFVSYQLLHELHLNLISNQKG